MVSPCLLFPFPLPFFIVPSKPGRGILLDQTHVGARGHLVAADASAAPSGERPAHRGHGALRIDGAERRRWPLEVDIAVAAHGGGGHDGDDEPPRPVHQHGGWAWNAHLAGIELAFGPVAANIWSPIPARWPAARGA